MQKIKIKKAITESSLVHVCIQTNQWQEDLKTTFSATLINNIVPLRIEI
jgi:hypothetical protein